MPNIDLRQRSFDLAVRIVRLCRYLDRQPGSTRALSAQLIRSGTSVGANVEEAQAGQSKADFVCKMMIALKEARETCYWLRVLSASRTLPSAKISELQTEAEQIRNILGAIVVSTKKNLRSAGGD